MLAPFCLLIKKIYSDHTANPNESPTAAKKKEDVTTKRLSIWSTFRQSLMASVGESQLVEKTRV